MKNLRAAHLHTSGKKEDQVPVDLAVFGKVSGLKLLKCLEIKVTNTQGLAGLQNLVSVTFNSTKIDALEFLKETPNVESVFVSGSSHTLKDFQSAVVAEKFETSRHQQQPASER